MSPVARAPELPPVVVGTAGHVDHGKTSLVKMLTGCDTDRLPEEKLRGMSINLGFAPCRLPGNRVVGIVDVPGHIDFIRNMVAGASTIDVLLLVVAADDGVMPQTIEHLSIARLLGIRRLMAALTKIDIVDDEMRELAHADLVDFLEREGFPGAPVVPVSNVTLDGISQVRDTLDELVMSITREEDRRVFRMNVERSFSVKGLGAVASGVPISGVAPVGARLELLPVGKETGVRSVQNYKHESGEAVAHVCTALNLRDLGAEEVVRGMTLVPPGMFTPSLTALATVRNISKSREIRHNGELHFHSGTMETPAKVGLLEGGSLRTGATGIAQLKFQAPLVLASGDKFILRSLSPSETLAGGAIISPCAFGGKRSDARLRSRLEAASTRLEKGDVFGAALLAGPHHILSRVEAMRMSRLVSEHAVAAVEMKIADGTVADLGEGMLAVRERLAEPVNTLVRLVDAYHKRHKFSFGLGVDAAAPSLGLKTACLQKLLAILPADETRLTVSFGRVALRTFKPAINKRQMLAKEEMLQLLRACGCKAPSRGNMISELRISEQDYEVAVAALLEENAAVVFGNHVMEAASFEKCKAVAEELHRRDGHIDIAAFKEATEMGRNIAVEILEKFDAAGLTRRVGGKRILI